MKDPVGAVTIRTHRLEQGEVMSREPADGCDPRIGRRHFLCVAVIGCIPWPKANASESGLVPRQGDMALKESERASNRMELCSAANPEGVGLQAEYFAAADCTGPAILSRVEGPVELDAATVWPQGSPGSARWRGWVKPPLPGKYVFHADHPGAKIVVARQVFQGGDDAISNQIELEAGRYYPVLLEVHGLNISMTGVRLEWTAPHGMRFVVPRALLYLPT
ncbi:MAG: hypothetical protein B7Y51_03320 [Burkholderiales bacterium 28-67-8]|nr:MAG: hypothetical protein B7Y51_03320 [Burkholderiales bacterium 28-67-8]